MSIEGMNANPSNGSNDYEFFRLKKEHWQKFESIFNRLDQNGDGKIDKTDNWEGNDKVTAERLIAVFYQLQQHTRTNYELTLNGIREFICATKSKNGADPTKVPVVVKIERLILNTIKVDRGEKIE